MDKLLGHYFEVQSPFNHRSMGNQKTTIPVRSEKAKKMIGTTLIAVTTAFIFLSESQLI